MSGAGQIIQRDTTVPRSKCRVWRLRLSLGRDPMTGKYRTANKTIHGTYREAQEALRRWAVELEPSTRQKMTLGEYMDDYKARELAAGRKVAQQHASVYRHLGAVRLCDIDAGLVTAWLDRLAAEGYKDSTRSSYRSYLMRILKDAARSHTIASEPRLDPMRPANRSQPREALTGQQVASVMGLLDPTDAHHVAVALALLAGLRRQEASELLMWEDVDLEARLMRVRGTKTAASDAVVPISRELASILEQWQASSGRASGPVVGLTSNALGMWWQRSRGKLGLDGVPFHALRHTFVSLLAQADVHPAVMQRLARHASPTMTMRVYTHVHMEQERAGVDALSGLLDGTKNGTNNPA